MPPEIIPLDPAETFPVTLDRHDHLPKATRPTWRFRFSTRREARELRDIWATLDEIKLLPEPEQDAAVDVALDRIEAYLRDKLAGWSHQPAGPFDPGRFDETCLETDLPVFLAKLRAINRLGPTLLGKFESQSRTHSAASVARHAPEPDAETPPPLPSPPKSSVPSATPPEPPESTPTENPSPVSSAPEPVAS